MKLMLERRQAFYAKQIKAMIPNLTFGFAHAIFLSTARDWRHGAAKTA
ncbi:MAG: hypothetical protein ACLPIX_21300 [Rhodomicrobium sp.]